MNNKTLVHFTGMHPNDSNMRSADNHEDIKELLSRGIHLNYYKKKKGFEKSDIQVGSKQKVDQENYEAKALGAGIPNRGDHLNHYGDRAFGANITNAYKKNSSIRTRYSPVVHSSNTPTNITQPIVVIYSSKSGERNKKAVQAKLENPELLSPTEALCSGGFIIPKKSTGTTIIDGTSLR
jgi:hypothetical protein